MTPETAVLESSPEVPVIEVDRGALVTLTKEARAEYRKTGELPEPPKKEEAASSSESAGASETPKKQGISKVEPKPKKSAEDRILELESTIEKIKKGAGIEKPKAESEPAKPVQVSSLRPKPTPDDKKSDGTAKYSTHAEYIEDLTDWKWEDKTAKRATEEAANAQTKALNDKIEEARTRYENLDGVIGPAANEIAKDPSISPVIKQMIGDSDVIADLLFTLSSDKEEFAKFMTLAKESPGKAIRYIALTESLIAQELEGKKTPVEEPAKPKTQAPKPPIEAGGRASTPPDSLQAALEGSAGKLNGSLKAEFLRRDLAKLRS